MAIPSFFEVSPAVQTVLTQATAVRDRMFRTGEYRHQTIPCPEFQHTTGRTGNDAWNVEQDQSLFPDDFFILEPCFFPIQKDGLLKIFKYNRQD